MASMLRSIVCVTLLLASATLVAGEPQPLEGTWQVAGRTLVDPPPGEPATHLYLFLEGESARALYEALDVQALEDECLADGSKSKTLGGTWCVHRAEDGAYECSFGIDLKQQRVDAHTPC